MATMKITKRDVIAFLLGFLTLFIIESLYDWEGTKKAINDGYRAGSAASE